MEEFEYKGKWWLPEKPDEKLSGILKFHPVTGARLELVGSFIEFKADLKINIQNQQDLLLLNPDIILVDIEMPGLNGIEVAKEILAADRDTAVIVLSAYDYDSYVLSTLQAGVRGYILKTTPPEELLKALHLIYSGKTVLGVSARDKIKTLIKHGDDPIAAGRKQGFLGDRELSVLTMIAGGLTNKEIAIELDISERTVQAHLANILKKTGTKSRTHAVLHALKGGWISLYD